MLLILNTQWKGEGDFGNPQLIRAFHDWILEFVATFFDLLYSKFLSSGGEDKISWRFARHGVSRVPTTKLPQKVAFFN